MTRFIERASPRQREMLGFPAPGDRYWSEETLAGIAARYPAMDMSPYLEAVAMPPSRKQQLQEGLRALRTQNGESAAPEAASVPSKGAANDAVRNMAERHQVARYYAWRTGTPLSYWLPWIVYSVTASPR